MSELQIEYGHALETIETLDKCIEELIEERDKWILMAHHIINKIYEETWQSST